MSAQLAAEYTKLLGIKKELLNKLLVSLRRSVDLLREDDMDAFDAEMTACQEITGKIDELGCTLDRIREQALPARQEEAAALESGIKDMIRQIKLAQKECNDVAEQKLHTYGQQIKAIRHTKKGIEGYHSQFQKRDAVFIDEKK